MSMEGREVDEEQEGEQPKSRPKAVFVPTMVLLFFVIVVVAFLNSPIFRVTQVEVVGSRYFSDQEIMLLSGIEEGQNIFTAPLETIEQRLMKVPRLSSVHIERKLPDTLRITVDERQTVAYVPYAGYFVELDDEGCAICIAEAVTDPDIPIIVGVDVTYAAVGQSVSPKEEITTCCYVGSLLVDNMISNLSEISVSQDGSVTVLTTDGIRLLFGDKGEIEPKVELLSPILASVREQTKRAKSIDLRIETKPVVTY